MTGLSDILRPDQFEWSMREGRLGAWPVVHSPSMLSWRRFATWSCSRLLPHRRGARRGAWSANPQVSYLCAETRGRRWLASGVSSRQPAVFQVPADRALCKKFHVLMHSNPSIHFVSLWKRTVGAKFESDGNTRLAVFRTRRRRTECFFF